MTRIDNDPWALAEAVREAGEAPEVAIEATYGWVRHRAPGDRVGCKDPPAACRSRPLKPAAGQVGSGKARRLLMIRGGGGGPYLLDDSAQNLGDGPAGGRPPFCDD